MNLTKSFAERSAAEFARRGLQLLFWPWNVVLCAVVVFGYAPLALKDQVLDAVVGLARWDFVVGSVVLCAVPLVTTAYAFLHRDRYREHPLELAELFFGVELPLLAITAARLFGFHQLSDAGQFVYVALVAGGLVAESRLVLGGRFPAGQITDGVSHMVLTLRFVAGSYVGFLLVNLTLPLLVGLVVELADGEVPAGAWAVSVLVFPVTLFVVASALLLLTLPVTAPLAWFAALKSSGRAVQQKWGYDDLLFTTGAPVVVAVVGFALLVPQPHRAAQALLVPVTDDAARRALVDNSAEIEAGLVDAWLSRHTYVADNDNDVWGTLWSLNRRLLGRAERRDISATMNAAARPFVFDGSFSRAHDGALNDRLDEQSARRLYRAFFGREIERDHAREARDALAATWSREERFAGFINEGAQRVRLAAQSVSAAVPEAGSGVVDVEVHDVWVNQTQNDEEVALFFELPESAALTGLWLSPTQRKEDGFAYVVAPRGAAQQLYNEEVRARRDPALVEQVGPRQYRLRVFPVPARPPRARDLWNGEAWAGPEAPRVHVFLGYQALVGAGGAVALPRLRERRNGFWDADTVRVVNGDVVVAADATDKEAGGGEWVQGSVVVDAAEATVVKSALVGGGVGVEAAVRCLRLTPWPAPTVDLHGKIVDVVVDRSLSLAPHRAALSRALGTLRATGATLRFVLGTSALRNEPAVAVDAFDDAAVAATVFFGAAQPKELLQQLLAQRPGLPESAAVVVLAGAAAFDVASDDKLDLSALPQQKLPPTLLVHVSGEMPRGYDDVTLDAVRASGGAATADLDEALARLSPLTFVDGHRVDVSSGCSASLAARPVVARQAILLADRNGKAPLDALDALHALAVEAAVVTPYSSMIVLDARQRERLRQLNRQNDRFDREIEQDQKKIDAAPHPGQGATLLFLASCSGQLAPAEDAVVDRGDRPTTEVAPPPAPEKPAEPAPSAERSLVDPGRVDGKRDQLAAPPPSSSSLGQLGQLSARATQGASMIQVVLDANEKAVTDSTAGTDGKEAAAADKDIANKGEVAAVVPSTATTFAPATAESTPTPTTTPTTTPAPQTVSGVPEPHEWLLVMLAGVAVVVLARRRQA